MRPEQGSGLRALGGLMFVPAAVAAVWLILLQLAAL
jgi:hypothetical protein